MSTFSILGDSGFLFVISIINWVSTFIINPDMYFLPKAEKLWCTLLKTSLTNNFLKIQKHVKRKYRLILIQSLVFGNLLAAMTFESYIRFSEAFFRVIIHQSYPFYLSRFGRETPGMQLILPPFVVHHQISRWAVNLNNFIVKQHQFPLLLELLSILATN